MSNTNNLIGVSYTGNFEFYDGSTVKVHSFVFSEHSQVVQLWIEPEPSLNFTKQVILVRNGESFQSERFWPYKTHRDFSAKITMDAPDIVMGADGVGHLFIRGDWYDYAPNKSRGRLIPPDTFHFFGHLVGRSHISSVIAGSEELEIIKGFRDSQLEKVMTI